MTPNFVIKIEYKLPHPRLTKRDAYLIECQLVPHPLFILSFTFFFNCHLVVEFFLMTFFLLRFANDFNANLLSGSLKM